MTLPELIKAEVKFTTNSGVMFPKRERESLTARDKGSLGLLAVLFQCSEARIGGKWLIADSNARWATVSTENLSVSAKEMIKISAGQHFLDELRAMLDRTWPPFLDFFMEDALGRFEDLVPTLEKHHSQRKLIPAPAGNSILETDHMANIAAIVDKHGASSAGRVFQVLFAYLLGAAGYKSVVINPVGVPDIELSQPLVMEIKKPLSISLSPEEALRLRDYCAKAGDSELCEHIKKLLP